jgi:hypothetical protein
VPQASCSSGSLSASRLSCSGKKRKRDGDGLESPMADETLLVGVGSSRGSSLKDVHGEAVRLMRAIRAIRQAEVMNTWQGEIIRHQAALIALRREHQTAVASEPPTSILHEPAAIVPHEPLALGLGGWEGTIEEAYCEHEAEMMAGDEVRIASHHAVKSQWPNGSGGRGRRPSGSGMAVPLAKKPNSTTPIGPAYDHQAHVRM